MAGLESARIAPQKQVGQREAKITAKIVMDALDVYEREIQQAAEPYSAMFCAIERLELDSRTHDSQYKVLCEENAALKAQVAALAELSAPFTQEEMDSVDHCACVYCRAKWSLLLVARLAAAQCQHLRTERSQLTHKPGTYTCMDCGALVTEQQLGDAIAAEQEGGK